ncbi:Hypothetical_protein [Hexamita inflata]|uniref:Hypothetical_protein n=1 Tax=Hexamita inflata TaxID=28002 RepID=A0AA86RS52_9EUKA|nr:Hypothetical protein HINF_LOCUS55251 [Hexamita inflata]CAI9971600.1 Hypothetical protein HINF_LOCUS59245 [Hexamita inflata]
MQISQLICIQANQICSQANQICMQTRRLYLGQPADFKLRYHFMYSTSLFPKSYIASTAANAQVQNQQVQPASPAAPITQNRTQPVKVVNKKRQRFSYKRRQEIIKHYKVVLVQPMTNTIVYFALNNVKEHNVHNFLRKEYQNKILQALKRTQAIL